MLWLRYVPAGGSLIVHICECPSPAGLLFCCGNTQVVLQNGKATMDSWD